MNVTNASKYFSSIMQRTFDTVSQTRKAAIGNINQISMLELTEPIPEHRDYVSSPQVAGLF